METSLIKTEFLPMFMKINPHSSKMPKKEETGIEPRIFLEWVMIGLLMRSKPPVLEVVEEQASQLD
jgi:hypothetical protein